ncbi:MAG: sugar transferase, partial [Gammaproteobacteria bacterium]
MFRIFRHYIPKTLVLLGLAELLILFVSIFLGASFNASSGGHMPGADDAMPLWTQALVFAAAIVLGMTAMGLYDRDQRALPGAVMLRLGLSFLCGFVVMGTLYLLVPGLMVGGTIFATALVCSFIGIASCRLVCAANDELERAVRVLVLGCGERAKQIENLQRSAGQGGVQIVGFVAVESREAVVSTPPMTTLVGDVNLRELAENLDIDEIVVAIDDRRKSLPVDAILECKMHGIRIFEAADFLERQLGKIRLDTLHPSNVIFADGFTQAVIKLTEKRILDILASLVLLVVALPAMLVSAVAIFLESGGPVLYRQQRVGRRGKVFTLYKFRSMRQDAEAGGAVWARQNDTRVTRVGAFIRKTRIDELPQLFN